MANEVIFIGPSSLTAYFTVRNSSGNIWNTNAVAFEAPGGNQPYYAIPLTEDGVGSGFYQGNFPVLIPAPSTYTITIFQQSGGSPSVSDQNLGAGQYYWVGAGGASATDWITLAYLKTYLNLTSSTSDALLAQLITNASEALNQSLQRIITLTFYYEPSDGTGYSFLSAENYPLQSLSYVIQNYQQNNPTTFQGNQFVYNAEGTIRWSQPANKSYFATGFQNYLLSYQAGYNPVPSDLQLACCMYCQFLYFYSMKDPTVTDKKAKDVSIAYGRALMGDFSDSIFAPIEAILKRYRSIAAN